MTVLGPKPHEELPTDDTDPILRWMVSRADTGAYSTPGVATKRKGKSETGLPEPRKGAEPLVSRRFHLPSIFRQSPRILPLPNHTPQ